VRLRTILLLVVMLALGAGGGVLASSAMGRPSSVVVQFGDASSGDGPIRVYISGAVKAPGVYPLRQGDRVVDAVEAAGGPADDADTESLNFAERLQDGEHLRVPRVGESPQAEDLPTPTGLELVDINRADVNLLRSLPGLGPTRAANIVTSREKDGPFKQPQDLVTRKLLSQNLFDQVKSLIVVGP
jgi:competence protein ComEA